jgi:hypothetical protein
MSFERIVMPVASISLLARLLFASLGALSLLLIAPSHLARGTLPASASKAGRESFEV